MSGGVAKEWSISPQGWTVNFLPLSKNPLTSKTIRSAPFFSSPLVPGSEGDIRKVLIDTGTSGCILPTSLANQIFDICKRPNAEFPMMLEFLVFDNVLPVPIGNLDVCTRMVSGGAERRKMIILGNLFMHANYLVFDKTMDPPIIGFAPLSWSGYAGSNTTIADKDSITRYTPGTYPNSALISRLSSSIASLFFVRIVMILGC